MGETGSIHYRIPWDKSDRKNKSDDLNKLIEYLIQKQDLSLKNRSLAIYR